MYTVQSCKSSRAFGLRAEFGFKIDKISDLIRARNLPCCLVCYKTYGTSVLQHIPEYVAADMVYFNFLCWSKNIYQNNFAKLNENYLI